MEIKTRSPAQLCHFYMLPEIIPLFFVFILASVVEPVLSRINAFFAMQGSTDLSLGRQSWFHKVNQTPTILQEFPEICTRTGELKNIPKSYVNKCRPLHCISNINYFNHQSSIFIPKSYCHIVLRLLQLSRVTLMIDL